MTGVQEEQKVITLEDGRQFKGQLLGGKPHGEGVLYDDYEGLTWYEGEFVNGMRHGNGKQTWEAGDYYQG